MCVCRYVGFSSVLWVGCMCAVECVLWRGGVVGGCIGVHLYVVCSRVGILARRGGIVVLSCACVGVSG